MPSQSVIAAVTGTCVSFSFMLVGNAITQTFMTIPALLVSFPPPGSTNHATRARLLGQQWPYCFNVGNIFFRPISMLGFIGYAFSAYSLYTLTSSAKTTISPHPPYLPTSDAPGANWRVVTISAFLHLCTVVHSAVNMQPLNRKLLALSHAPSKDLHAAEETATKWGKWNLVRVVNPLIAGSLALWQLGKL